jgi:membrane dipeptidase
MSDAQSAAKLFLENHLYFDVHGHPEGTIPGWMRFLGGRGFPPDLKLRNAAPTGLNGFVVCVLGDPNSFVHRKIDGYAYVLNRLRAVKKAIQRFGGFVALSAAELEEVAARRRPVFVLGIEGGDFIEEDLSRVEQVYKEGVRVFLPLHYSKNGIGSISLGWGGRRASESEQTGLTSFGEELIAAANELGLLLDFSHADERTLDRALQCSKVPVMSSHTGPRALQDFPRYTSDDGIRSIARAGGLIGMWPFFSRGAGVRDVEVFKEYFLHLRELVGTDHIAIGTDINGVPGNMEGYRTATDAVVLVRALMECGVAEDDLEKIAAGNFLRLFREVQARAIV